MEDGQRIVAAKMKKMARSLVTKGTICDTRNALVCHTAKERDRSVAIQTVLVDSTKSCTIALNSDCTDI